MIKKLFVSLPRLYKPSSAFQAFSHKLPQQFNALAFRPTFYFSESSNNNGERKIATIDLEKLLNEKIDINVQDKTISLKDGTVSYTLPDEVAGTVLGDEDRYVMMMTCSVCNHKMNKTFTKKAYHTGVVIIRCDSCENNHLIADNLGWFRDTSVNVEDLAREKGEEALRVNNSPRLQQILQSMKYIGHKGTQHHVHGPGCNHDHDHEHEHEHDHEGCGEVHQIGDGKEKK